jgi:hypothetical protein
MFSEILFIISRGDIGDIMKTIYVLGNANQLTLGIGSEWVEPWRPSHDHE